MDEHNGIDSVLRKRRRVTLLHPPPMAGRKWTSLSGCTGARRPRVVMT